MSIDVAHRVYERILLEICTLERKRAIPVQLLVRIVVHWRAVRKTPGDIRVMRGDREAQRLGGTAHREQKSALLHVLPHLLGDGFLERRKAWVTEALCRLEATVALFHEPGRVTKAEVQLVELSGEIFV